jgi:hypothetical protein
MAYRLTYMATISWVPAGLGPGLSQPPGPGMAGPNNAQSITLFNAQGTVSGVNYPPSSTTFTNTDVVNLLNSMTTDLTTQMENAAFQTRVQNFSTGGG